MNNEARDLSSSVNNLKVNQNHLARNMKTTNRNSRYYICSGTCGDFHGEVDGKRETLLVKGVRIWKAGSQL